MLNGRNYRSVIPKRREINEMSLMMTSALLQNGDGRKVLCPPVI
jgi:hypothetical protein